MIEHFELAQESRSCLCDADLCQEGRDCSVLCANRDRSKYIRLSSDSFPDLEGPQLEILSKLCLDARRSEEVFLSPNATDQWLRTIIGHKHLTPGAWTKAETWPDLTKTDFIIHSNILPYDPYWSKPLTTTTRVHFPSCILKEALKESKPLKTKLLEWKSKEEECEIAKHGTGGSNLDGSPEQPRTSKLFRKIQGAHVKHVRGLGKGTDGNIILITWNGGRFVQKEFWEPLVYEGELEVVKKFSHPHIIHSFGELCDGKQPSYFMEYMSRDLFNFIFDKTQRVDGVNKPPFSRHDSVDVLSQVAKAMSHMHEVNVVHCDLKSLNILISEIAASDNVKHFLVKVADFGSARSGYSRSPSSGFSPGPPSTAYAAPEVLIWRADKTVPIACPRKIDVYSFGIVAFEVLTGKNNSKDYKRSPSEFKKGVIEGLRLPLRAECVKQKVFAQDEDLISLIKRCWHKTPCERPSFVEICEELDKIRDQMLVSEHALQSGHPPCQGTSFWNFIRGATCLKV